jgi:demethylmenaquinone methyltransferase/2-methoxy-6-polyprenyl-1,4-benzoquinol methylase
MHWVPQTLSVESCTTMKLKGSAPRRIWDAVALRDPHAQPDKACRVRDMFDSIAPVYERFNRIATFGQDARWRRAAVRAAQPAPGETVLDVACGTGDMIRAFARDQPGLARIIGVDFSARMLRQGSYRGLRVPIELIQADALSLPLGNCVVDIVACAFGLRNFDDLCAALREMYRVLRPRGRLVILEFAWPSDRWFRWLYELYCGAVLPRLGRLLVQDRAGAYEYLPRSVRTFEPPQVLARRLQDTGFAGISLRPMVFGAVVLYGAKKPGRGAR